MTIGKYTVEKELGRGGFGRVYLAFDPEMERKVAIKVLLDPDKLKYFEFEAFTTGKLQHKNVVTIYDRGKDEANNPFLVMEFLEGSTLKEVIERAWPLTLLEKVHIMTQTAEGLAYAHSRGVVHRDIKPENIMLLPDHTVKIMDFGIALAPERADITRTGYMVGSQYYMAPEQFTNADLKANEQTDIFAFGAVSYELLTGKHPFLQIAADYGVNVITAVLNYEAAPLGQLAPGCPEALELLVHRSLSKDPAFRYRKFSDVALYSQEILADLQHERASGIVDEVRGLLTSGHVQEARAKVLEAQQLEPGNREARRLRDQIDQQIQRAETQARIAELLSEADRRMEQRRFPEAVQSLESAARRDSGNVTVRERLVEARSKLERFARANRLVEEGRSQEDKGRLTEALERLKAAVETDPEHTEASRLLRRVTDKLDQRRRDLEREQAIRSAMVLLAAKSFAEAHAALDALEREQPGAAGVAELRARIDSEKAEDERRRRAERFNLALARTRETMQAGDLERAREMIDHLFAHFADEPGAGELLSGLRDRWQALKSAQEIASYRQQAQGLLRRKAFREAQELLTEGLHRFPEDTGLRRLNRSAAEMGEAQRRSEAIAAVLEDAAKRRDAGDIAAALAVIAEGRRRLGDQPALVDRTRHLELELEQQRYSAGLEQLLKAGRELLSAGKYADAIDRLAAGLEYAGEAEVRALLQSARAAAAIQEEKRFVEERLAAAGKLESEGRCEQALGLVEEGLAVYPHSPGLASAVDRLRDTLERQRRRRAIDQHRTAIRHEIDAQRWKRADALLREGRLEFPGESAFDDLAAEIDHLLFEVGLNEVALRVREKLAANQVRAAEDDLATSRSMYGHDPRWKELEQEIARRREYEAALAAAEQSRKAGNLDAAEQALTGVLPVAPDQRATRMFETIRAQRSAARQAGIRAAADRVRGALRRDDLAAAANDLRSARAAYPEEPLWDALQGEIDARQAGLKRRAEMEAAAQRIREALRRDDIAAAEAGLGAARAAYPDEALWGPLQAEIEARQADLKRRAAIDAAAQRIRGALRQDDVASAIGELRDARAAYPDEPHWVALQAEIEAATTDRTREFLRRDDVASAAGELRAARAALPDEPLWDTLQAEIDARQAELRRREEISAAAGHIREALHRAEFASAANALRSARAGYPGEPLWDTLQAEIDARQAEQRRRAEIAATATERTREFLRHDDVASAANELRAARGAFPDEPLWNTLQAEIDAHQAELNRRAGIAAAAADRTREFLRRDDVASAADELRAARGALPDDLWSGLQRDIEARQADLKRRADVDAAAQRIREALRRDDVTSAATELRSARRAFADDPQWDTLQAEIDAHQAELSRRAERVQRIRDALRRDDVTSAATELRSARRAVPDDPQWDTLQAEIDAHQAELSRRVESVQRIREALRRDDVTSAATELRSARRALPDDPQWDTLQAEIDAHQAELSRRVESVQRIREALRRDDVTSAATELRSARRAVPDDPQWDTLQAEIDAHQAELNRRAEIAAAAERTREFLRRDDVASADKELRAARGALPDDLWSSLQRDIEARQADLKRRADVDAAAQSIREALRSDDVTSAATGLRSARRAFADDPQWDTLQAEIDAHQAELNRRAEIAAAAERTREFLRRDDVASADKELRAARGALPDDLWSSLQRDIEARQADLKRRADMDAAAQRIREALRSDDVTSAATGLRSARRAFADDPQWDTLQAEIDAHQAELSRRAERVQRIREALRRDDAASADNELRAARGALPDDLWSSLQRDIEARQADLKRRADMDAAAQRIREALRSDDVTSAATGLHSARRAFADDPQWDTLQAEIDAHQAELNRRAEIAAAAERTREFLRRDDVASAASELRAARGALPDDLRVSLQREIEARQADLNRRTRVAVIAQRIREALQRDDVAAAANELRSARSTFPNDPLWATLQREIEARQADLDRRDQIAAIAERVRASLQRNDPASASAALREARTRYPHEHLWTELQSEVEARQADIDRGTQVAGIAQRIREALRRDDLASAAVELRSGRAASPDDPLWATLQAEIDTHQADLTRQAEIDALAERVRACLRRNDPGAASAALREAQTRFPQEHLWTELQTEIHDRAAAAPVLPRPAKAFPWRMVGTAAAIVVLLVAAVAIVPRLFRKKPPPLVAVEVRTDPPGASVRLGSSTCVSPDCRLLLAPGRYQLEAQLNGFETAEQAVTVDTSKSTYVLDVPLKPIPPPPPPPEAKTGRLIVRTRPSSARVLVDGRPVGRTDSAGTYDLSLEPKAYEIGVEKDRYQGATRRVTIVADASQHVEFNLVPKDARLELAGAPGGIQVRVGNKLLGKTNGSPKYLFPGAVTPGPQALSITDGTASRQIAREFAPDETLHLNWSEVSLPKPQPPPKQPPQPKTPTEEEIKAAQAQKEELEWARVDQSSVESIEAFRNRFPGGKHADEAASLLRELQRKQAEAKSQLEKKRIEDERARQQLLAQQQAKGDIDKTIEGFNEAFNSRQRRQMLTGVWPTATEAFLTMPGTASLRECGPLVFTGDQAAEICQLVVVTRQPRNTSRQPMNVVLEKQGTEWKILRLDQASH